MREIVLDTETTGMEPADGHRLIEIGCVELDNHIPTGRTWHQYINPERSVPPDAVAVHGLTDVFLKDKPVFSQVFTDFLDFCGESRLVIHNAAFDMKFLNAELKTVGFPSLSMKRVTDTLLMAREKFPGSPANLDALCRRFGIDNTNRTLHGALLDAELLAEVYLELLGGRQRGLGLLADQDTKAGQDAASETGKSRPYRAPRAYTLSPEEKAAHEALLDKLTDPIWREIKKAG
ncbi:MAG: DNA polymerase III subunit epsilon [Alphaproteobacteria bacterium]|nr:DNA polymerase III subunit epsilon [Alphaproteobacteria bacterium]